MGVGKLGFGQVGGAKSSASAPKKMGFGSMGSSSRAADEGLSPTALLFKGFSKLLLTEIDEVNYARSKFGSQKGISSDEYFGRAAFDPAAQSEAKSRLQGFEGATSISSNAYFGRPEDDIPHADEYGNYGDLEGAARDFVRKFGVTAADDLENLSTVLGEGASKLQGWFGALILLMKRSRGRIDTDLGSRCDTKLSQQLSSIIRSHPKTKARCTQGQDKFSGGTFCTVSRSSVGKGVGAGKGASLLQGFICQRE